MNPAVKRGAQLGVSDRKQMVCAGNAYSHYEAEIVNTGAGLTKCQFLADNVNITYNSEQTTLNCLSRGERYRYQFNGKEVDKEGMGGGGSTYDYGFRIYNPQIGKFLSVDPLTSSYPWYTPYQFAGNKPIWAIDLDGKEEYYTSEGQLIGKFGTSTEMRIVYDEYVDTTTNMIAQQANNTPGLDVMNNILYNKGSAPVFSGTDEAAMDWALKNNQRSIDDDKEYSSFIFYTRINGRTAISYTKPVQGEEGEVTNTFSMTKSRRLLGSIHSHGAANPDYINNIFFDEHIDNKGVYKEGDIVGYKSIGLSVGYVSTPNGSLQKWTPFGESTLSYALPSDPSDKEIDSSFFGEQPMETPLPKIINNDK